MLTKKKIVYGRDDRHGRSGPDYSDPGSAFSTNTDDEGTGYELRPFRGEHLDKLSIAEILDDEAAEETVRMSESDQEFLSELGFGTDGSSLK